MTSNADIITVNGFAMRIIAECTAFNYIIILALAILLYTRHTMKYRLTGIAIATLSLLVANAVRLIVTGWSEPYPSKRSILSMNTSGWLSLPCWYSASGRSGLTAA